MYKLYYSPFSCSLAVHIALEKTGQDFELEKVDVRKSEHQSEEFLRINKRGKVPLLLDGDQVIDQGAGILLYLADKHPEADMIPAIGDPLRAEAISSLLYMSNTIHPTLAICFYPDRYSLGDTKGVLSSAIEKTKLLMTELNENLTSSPYLNGDKPYVADYYLATMLNWLQLFKITLEAYPFLLAFKQRMAQLAEVDRAVKKEMKEF